MTGLQFTGERAVPGLTGDIAIEHLHRYAIACDLVHGRTVLDIASGEGYGSHLLSQRARHVTGVDISSEAVAHAKTQYVASNLEFRVGDCTQIPLNDHSAEVVVSFETLEHHDKHDEMLREIKRVLVPGGLLVMSTPDKRTYSELPGQHNEFHVKELSKDEYLALLSRHFRTVRLAGQRMFVASAIQVDGDASPEPAVVYSGGFTHLNVPKRLDDFVYWIAIASDSDVPHVAPLSLFESPQLQQTQVAALSRRLDQIHASLSWRATAPLRWFGDMLHRLRNGSK